MWFSLSCDQATTAAAKTDESRPGQSFLCN